MSNRVAVVPDQFNQASYLVDRHLDEGRSENTAICYGDRKITYRELAAGANRAGNAFKDLGVEIENRVVLLMPDQPEFLYSYLGAMKIGAVPIPVNTLASPRDYVYFLNDSRARLLVVSDELLPKIQSVRDDLKYLRHVVTLGKTPPGFLSYHDLTGLASERLQAAPTSKDDMAYWMYTSGTTGVPKGVVHLHHDLVYYMYPFCEEVLGVTENDVIFATSKMFFSYGRNASLEIPLLYGGATVLYSLWPDAANVFEVIRTYRPTIFFSVPTFYRAMLREVDKTGVTCDLSSVRVALTSGEPMPRELHERCRTKLGLQVIDVIGSTDVGAQYLSTRPSDMRPGSSGKLIEGFEGMLRDAEGAMAPRGEVGTLWLKNDGIASQYWNKHERSKEVFKGDWFNTGDLFHQDNDGYYWYQGRGDDMLKVSGQWVSPLEIEEVLQKHTAVRECGVIGAPDESGLVRVKAFVVLNEGCEPCAETEKELAVFVHDRIAHFKTPRWVQFVEDLPRTTTGKLQRHKLRTGP